MSGAVAPFSPFVYGGRGDSQSVGNFFLVRPSALRFPG